MSRRPRPMTLVWVTFVRGVMAIVLGVALALDFDRAPGALLNFMGVYWILNGAVTLRLGLLVEGRRRRLALAAGSIGIATAQSCSWRASTRPSCSRSSAS